jgi:N-glycosylase/DNA lyase
MGSYSNNITRSDFAIDLKSTLFSGQSFSWNYSHDKHHYYASVFGNNALLLRQIDSNTIEFRFTGNAIGGLPIDEFIRQYLSLDIDPEQIFPDSFQEFYPEIWNLIKRYLPVRVIRQDPFETLVTFMCAQGIGMGLIRRQVSMIAERYGDKLVIETETGSLLLHTFPTPQALAGADVNELAMCTNNNRARASNIIAMARSFESGALALTCVQAGVCPLDTLRDSLCVHRGIGMKIADCVALFGLGRFDAFPIDTHVKQYLWEWFGIEAARSSLTERNYRYLQDEARKILGEKYAGYAGHILFHCWRTEIRKMTAF